MKLRIFHGIHSDSGSDRHFEKILRIVLSANKHDPCVHTEIMLLLVPRATIPPMSIAASEVTSDCMIFDTNVSYNGDNNDESNCRRTSISLEAVRDEIERTSWYSFSQNIIVPRSVQNAFPVV